MNEDELLVGKAEDKIKQSADRNMVTATGFLDPHQQSILRSRFHSGDAVTKIIYYGGYDDAERVMMICLPEYVMMPNEMGGSTEAVDSAVAEMISVARVTHSEKASASRTGRPLSHGDYLGALMGLGLEREVIGDIIVRGDGADILIPKEMSDFILSEFRSAGKSELEVEIKELDDLILPEREMKEYSDTVASPRLDNFVSSAFGLSRSKAVTAIKSGLVFVNHVEMLKPSVLLKEGDEVVVRHKGRAVLSEFGGTSRKGRQYITYLKD